MSSSTDEPAGQDGRVQGEIWPTTARFVEDRAIFDHSLQQPELHSNDVLQGSGSVAEASGSFATTETATDALQCEECLQTFPQRYLLKYALFIITVLYWY